MNIGKFMGVAAVIFSLSACGVQSNEDLAKLKIEEYAVKVCESVVDFDMKQIEVMFEPRQLERLNNRVDEWRDDIAQITCDEFTTKERKRGLQFKFKAVASRSLRITITKINGIYQVVDV